MKTILMIFCFIVPSVAVAIAPATECPTGYVAVNERYMLVRSSCPAGTSSAGDAESCLVANPVGACIMYAPAGVSYTDTTGTYEFSEACMMYQ